MSKKVSSVKGSFFLRVKTRQEVANEYGITPRTLNNRLKKANLYIPNGAIFPKSLKKIYNALGFPPETTGEIAQK
jgi:transcriptional antiterminator